LGASFDQIVRPFLFTTAWVLWWAYGITILLLLISGVIVSWYMRALFDTTVWLIIGSYGLTFWIIVLLQFIIMVWWSLFFSYAYVQYLTRHDN
jgi:hypothetical protein